MKQLLSFLFLLITSNLVSQTNSTVKLKMNQDRLKLIKDVHQLIPGLAADCRIIRLELTYSDGKSVKVLEGTPDTFKNNNLIKTIASLPVNTLIQLIVKRSDCKEVAGKTYFINVVNND